MPDEDTFYPTPEYVSRFLDQIKQELRGLYTRIEETERIRYLEDEIMMPADEAKSGIEVRIGASAELIRNVKGAISVNPARVVIDPKMQIEGAGENAYKREQFWNRYLERNHITLSMCDDSTIANGLSFLKATRISYPNKPRERLRKGSGTQFDETEAQHVARVKALKRLWGPPFALMHVHPLAAFPRRGVGFQVAEIAEHSWKSKPDMYRNYGIRNARALKEMQMSGSSMLRPEVADAARYLSASSGIPDSDIRPMPYGTDTSTKCLVTEYWSPDYYQVYIDRRLIYEEQKPHTAYFMALGEITSSPDPDKMAFGVAELMRHNEPALNRAITRILEANELVGRKPAVELPEGSLDAYQPNDNPDDPIQPVEYHFKTDVGVSLPPGARIAHPFEGVQHVYESMGTINLLRGILNEHGVTPLFKGQPTASDSSGYRENSLYVMAKGQLQEVLKSLRLQKADLIKFLEQELIDLDETIYIDELELTPADVKNWPANVQVILEPRLPQNLIAEGSFWDRMWASGHISQRFVRETGFQLEDPAGMGWEVFIEKLQVALLPQLQLDILGMVLGNPGAVQPGAAEPTPGDNETRLEGSGSMGQENGGFSRGGQPRETAGSTV